MGRPSMGDLLTWGEDELTWDGALLTWGEVLDDHAFGPLTLRHHATLVQRHEAGSLAGRFSAGVVL
jgi:hypothetical protein